VGPNDNDFQTFGQTIEAKPKEEEFDIEHDPDWPQDAINSNIIVEEIEMNGKKQKVYRKTY